MDLLRARLAARAAQLLAGDEDDLFYEGGRYTSALMASLVRGGQGGERGCMTASRGRAASVAQ